MRTRFTLDDMLNERVTLNGVGAILRWIGTNPDGTDFSKIIVAIILKNGILLICNHAAEVEHTAIGEIVSRATVRLSLDIDDDRNRIPGAGIESNRAPKPTPTSNRLPGAWIECVWVGFLLFCVPFTSHSASICSTVSPVLLAITSKGT